MTYLQGARKLFLMAKILKRNKAKGERKRKHTTHDRSCAKKDSRSSSFAYSQRVGRLEWLSSSQTTQTHAQQHHQHHTTTSAEHNRQHSRVIVVVVVVVV